MEKQKLTLLVLAAGMGSRYGWLKQLDKFWQWWHTLLEYSIYDAIDAGFDEVVFVIREDFETEFKEQIGEKIEGKIPVQYAFQSFDALPTGYLCPATREKPWGTGHAVLCALPLIENPFVVINADDFYGRASYQVMSDFYKSDRAAGRHSIMGYTLSEVLSDFWTVSRGICQTDFHQNLQKIVETKNIMRKDDALIHFANEDGRSGILDDEVPCSMNMMGFDSSVKEFYKQYFQDFLDEYLDHPTREFYMPLVVQRLIDEEGAEIPVLSRAGKWFGVTYQEDKAATNHNIDTLIAQGEYPENLWA